MGAYSLSHSPSHDVTFPSTTVKTNAMLLSIRCALPSLPSMLMINSPEIEILPRVVPMTYTVFNMKLDTMKPQDLANCSNTSSLSRRNRRTSRSRRNPRACPP